MNWHEYFTYDDGKLIWKERPLEHFSSARTMKMWNTRFAGSEAGTLDKDGYVIIQLFEKNYRAHQIVWEMHNSHTYDEIDHIDRCKNNNKIENLRPCDRYQNMSNTKPIGSISAKGVYFSKKDNRYYANICVKGKRQYLGSFTDPAKAADAYEKAAKKLHGEFFWR